LTTDDHAPIDDPTAGRASAGTSRKTIVVAIVAVALVAAGASLAATRLHGGSNSAAPGPGASGAPSVRGTDGAPDEGRGGFRRGFGRGAGFGGLSAAATYLGLSTSQLFADLQSGKTLGSIAAATPGKSVDGLVAVMVASEKSPRW
jgi:hypothetical protein